MTTDNAQVDGHITAIAPAHRRLHRPGAGGREPAREGGRHARRARPARPDRPAGAGRGGPAERAGGGGLAQARRPGRRHSSRPRGPRRRRRRPTIAAAEATYRQASADYERYRGLAASKIISAQQLDAAQAARDAAAANLEAARRQAAAAGSQVSASGAALRGADARLAAAQSAVDNARLQLGYATLLAPNAGVVAKRNAEPGALVQVGQNLLSIVPDDGRLGHGQPQGDPARQGAGGRRGRVQRGRLPGP